MNPYGKFWNESTYAIVKAIKATGNQIGIVTQWKESVEAWANANPTDPDAIASKAWFPLWKIRPFYGVAELVPIWPALAIAVGHTDKWKAAPPANRLGNELEFAGLPSIRHNNKKLFIVERVHYWKNASLQEISNVLEGM